MADYHVQALQLAQAQQWDASHRIIQEYDDAFACQIHACLHRIEGDLANAGYWYRRANAQAATGSVEDELEALLSQARSMD